MLCKTDDLIIYFIVGYTLLLKAILNVHFDTFENIPEVDFSKISK